MKQTQTSNIRIDDSVTLTMIIVTVMAALFLTFKVVNKVPCTDFRIMVDAPRYYTGENISFSTNLGANDKLDWSFGDGSSEKSRTGRLYHNFKSAGVYTIVATANGTCQQPVSVKISNAPIIIDTAILPDFYWPRSAVVGVPVSFQDNTIGANVWEWRFGESASIDATSNKPTYIFKTAGIKTITLMVNNDPNRLKSVKLAVTEPPRKQVTAARGGNGAPRIIFTGAPQNGSLRPQGQNGSTKTDSIKIPQSGNNAPTNVTNVRTAPSISRPQLEGMLRDVANHAVLMKSFSKYFADIDNTPVILNGKYTTFKDFYNELNGLKSSSKIKTLNVQMQVESQSKAINQLVVEYKKSGFLGL